MLRTGNQARPRRTPPALLVGGVLLACAAASAGCFPRADLPPAGAAPATPLPLAPPDFEDVTAASGLSYKWEIRGKRPLNILQTIGNGCAFLDYDGDGNLDVLLVGPKPALFQGDGKGRFADVSARTGVGRLSGHFLGCAVGDADNDGFPDVYLSGFREAKLLHNRKGKAFADVTAASGLKPQPWGTSCAFVETRPGSGRLDLVVANYARFGPEPGIKQLCDTRDRHGKMVQTSCGPRDYEPLRPAFYRNEGGLRFADATDAAGFGAASGRGLGVAACDYDGSGRAAVAFANDEIGGDLLRWEGAKARNVAETAGTAFDRDGNVHGGMGTDWGDYDNDGRFDLVVATFFAEPKSLYHNDGDGLFTDVSYRAGVGTASLPYVAFGAKFFDYDNDGWLDLIFANGHVQDNIEEIEPKTTYRQPSQLFRNSGGAAGRPAFEDVTRANPALSKPVVGRGLATGDYDNDGRVDVLVVDSEGTPLLLRNRSGGDRPANRWLGLRLIGTRANRDGYGAVVTVTLGDRKWVRHCHADGSYLSASDPRVHIGLGAAATGTPKVTVRWPGGRVQTIPGVALDRYTTAREESAAPP